MRRLLALASLATFLAAPPARAGDTADECADAYEAAQREQKAGRMRAALKNAVTCADERCPVILRRECTEWVAPLRARIPTVSVRVLGADGCDRSEATIEIDGEVVATSANGTAIEVDPGPHTLRVIAPGAAPYEERIVAAEGDRARPIVASFAPPGVTCGQRAPVPPVRTPEQEPPRRPVPTLAVVFAGVGLAGLGVSAGFGAAGFSKKSGLEDCKPGCSPDATDSMRSAFLVSDVALGVGLVSLGIATVLYLVRPEVR